MSDGLPPVGPANADVLDALLHGLTPDHLDELDQLLGLSAPQPDTTQEVVPPQGRGSRILQAFSGAENLPMPQPRGFGQGLVAGLTRGLGTAGSRVAAQRAQMEQQAQERQRMRDAANLRATEAYRAAQQAGRRGVVMSALAARAAQGKQEANDVTVTQDVIDKSPKNSPIRKLTPGTVLSRTQYEGALLKDTSGEQRAAAAAERAAEAAARQAQAADRQNRLAQVQTVNQLVNEYRQDPAIKGFQGVRSNLNTAEEAAKQKSGPGDIAIVFSFMRALEPENPNAVREGEYSNARQATGLLQQTLNLPNRYFKGNQLTEEGRNYFLTTMRGQLKSRTPDYRLANGQYRRRAEMGGIDPGLFVREFGTEPGAAPERQRPPLESFVRP